MANDPIIAQSVGRLAWDQSGQVSKIEPVWHVLAVFDRACNLVTPNGDVIALVLPEIGDGPLNIVVEKLDQSLGLVQPGMVATLRDARLLIGEVEVRLDQAAVWDPCPDWERLRRDRERLESRLMLVQVIALRHAPAGRLLALLVGQSGNPPYLTAVRQAAEGLRAAWRSGWTTAAAQLAGLGEGLTPAGDDFLSGVMLWAWLAHPDPEPFCRRLAEAAAPRTTTLSAALLRAAGRGECSAPWHRLLGALADGPEDRLEEAVQGVLSCGHTSGADILAGFLYQNVYAATRVPDPL